MDNDWITLPMQTFAKPPQLMTTSIHLGQAKVHWTHRGATIVFSGKDAPMEVVDPEALENLAHRVGMPGIPEPTATGVKKQ